MNLWGQPSVGTFPSRAQQPKCTKSSQTGAGSKLRFFQVVGEHGQWRQWSKRVGGLRGTGWRGGSWNLSWLGKIGSLGADSCSDFLIDSVTSGKLPHISGLQFFPTCKWGCGLIWLTSLPVLKFCGSILQKMQALFVSEKHCQLLLITGVKQPALCWRRKFH